MTSASSGQVATLGIAKGLVLNRVAVEPTPALKNRTFWSK
jgi:hypothetical protein